MANQIHYILPKDKYNLRVLFPFNSFYMYFHTKCEYLLIQ